MPLATDWPVLWANVWGLAFGLAAGLVLGFAEGRWGVITSRFRGRPRNHTQQSLLPRFYTPAGELELFITTTPDAFPEGRTLAPNGWPQEQLYTVTRVVDLGSFADILGRRHPHWRVYGRPA